MRKFVEDLEQFLVKYENLNNLIGMLNHEIFENIEDMPDNIATLSDTLVELSEIRINELECMVRKGLKQCKPKQTIQGLLNDILKEKYRAVLYGKDERSGLMDDLPAGFGLIRIGEECICCLLLLSDRIDLERCDMDNLYNLYCETMKRINDDVSIETTGDLFNKNGFLEFVGRIKWWGSTEVINTDQ